LELLVDRQPGESSDDLVTFTVKDRVAFIGLNRPAVLNAYNDAMHDQLVAAFTRFDLDDELWCAVVYGHGRAFTGGADVKEVLIGSGTPRERTIDHLRRASPHGFLGRCVNWKPVVAAVHGWCVGVGVSLALECDLIVATTDAKFTCIESKRGLPAGAIWARLQCFMPSKVATEFLLTGEVVPVEDLYRLGMINRVVEEGKHLDAAEELARQINEASPLAVRANVRITRILQTRLAEEAFLFQNTLRLDETEDFEEATNAFLQKRTPVYHAR
jgi:enoyl-CoA hydratase/carnithine racemase